VTELVRPWRGVSAADRHQARREQLLDACLDVVADAGVYAATVEMICARSKLTKRYFYQQFADRDAILLAAIDDMFTTMFGRVTEATSTGADIDTNIEAATEILFATFAEDPRVIRLFLDAPGHPMLRERHEQAVSAFAEVVAGWFVVSPGERTTVAQVVAARLLIAGTADVIANWLSGAIDGDRATVRATISTVAKAAVASVS
jgi:AcrR family transcriptional regulator